jgi:hypothetical protein
LEIARRAGDILATFTYDLDAHLFLKIDKQVAKKFEHVRASIVVLDER